MQDSLDPKKLPYSAHRQLNRLERTVDNWQQDLSRLEREAPSAGRELSRTFQAGLAELRHKWREARERIDTLKSTGERDLDKVQDWAQKTYRELVSAGQRTTEQLESLLVDGSDAPRNRYFLSPAAEDGWVLRKAGALAPAGRFDKKSEALAYASRYVRGMQPSELVVRRQDGTFQEVRRYGQA